MAGKPAGSGEAPAPAGERSEAQLVAAVLAGEREAFRPLLERHQGAIFGYLYRLLGAERETALDLTQSVFLKAYQSLASYDPRRPLAPWLYRIAHNEAANRLRSRARHPTAGLDDRGWALLPAGEGGDPETGLAQKQERERVHRALQQLKPRQKEVLELYYYEERGYDEIGEILSLPAGTVATLIRRGRKKLAELLEGEGGPP